MNVDFIHQIGNTGRYNLIIVPCQDNLMKIMGELSSAGVNAINIGKVLSEKLKTIESAKFLAIESQEYLYELIENQSKEIFAGKPKVAAIYNFGILFEPDLCLNVVSILKEISKNTAVIILWEHHISPEGILYWNSQKERYSLDLSDILAVGGEEGT